MTTIGHNIIGASIGLAFYESVDTSSLLAIFICFLAGLISHYIADAIPHGHYRGVDPRKINMKGVVIVVAETLTALLIAIIAYGIAGQSDPIYFLVASIFGAQLPDILLFLTDTKILNKGQILEKHEEFHSGKLIHWHNTAPRKGRLWSWTDSWQLIPLAILVVQFSYL